MQQQTGAGLTLGAGYEGTRTTSCWVFAAEETELFPSQGGVGGGEQGEGGFCE